MHRLHGSQLRPGLASVIPQDGLTLASMRPALVCTYIEKLGGGISSAKSTVECEGSRTHWIFPNTKKTGLIFFPPPLPPHVLMNFRGFPPGCGDSVADFWGWDAHEARLRCPDDVSVDLQEDEIPGGALSLNLLTTQTMVTTGIFPCKEKFPW